MRKFKWSGFTLIELLVVIAILSILMTILLPSISGVREQGRQTACTANMRNGLSIGLAQYGSLSGTASGSFPIIDSSQTNPCYPVSQSTTWDDGNIPSADGNSFSQASAFSGGVNGMQNIWLMVRAGCIQEASFHCPSDTDWIARTPAPVATGVSGKYNAKKYGWTAGKQYSYGLQWMYNPAEGTKDASGNPLTNNSSPALSGLDDAVVIAADQNPGGPVGGTSTTPLKPSNHATGGEALLYKSGQAKFYNNFVDSLAGKDQDDIYVNTNGDIKMPTYKTAGDGKDSEDTVIIPGSKGSKANANLDTSGS